MKKSYEKLFKTAPEKTFKEFFTESQQTSLDEINEAKRVVREAGCRVINESRLLKFITGAALSLGLISNAMAGEFNAQPNPSYISKTATTTSLSKEMQKNYNVKADLQMTDQMIWNIADEVSRALTAEMHKKKKLDAEDLFKLDGWKNAVEFYKIVNSQDPALANMFSRRVHRALKSEFGSIPSVQEFASL